MLISKQNFINLTYISVLTCVNKEPHGPEERNSLPPEDGPERLDNKVQNTKLVP
jgi:hypothetical protein